MSGFTSTTELLASRGNNNYPLIANSLPLNGDNVESFLHEYDDVVDHRWFERHCKLVYQIGFDGYKKLADKARTKNIPKGYMAFLVNKNIVVK